MGRLADESGSTDAVLDALTLKGVVAWLTLADEAETTDTAFHTLAGQLGQAAPQWQGAMLLELELGRESEARRAFDELADAEFAALPRDSEWLFCLALLAEVAAQLPDHARAAVLYRLLGPYARVNAMAAGEVALGPVARYLGILAATTARWEEAAGHFEDAIAMNAKMGARPALAHTRHDYGRMLLARDQSGDEQRALELLGGAVSLYRELGMESWAQAATELLHAERPSSEPGA